MKRNEEIEVLLQGIKELRREHDEVYDLYSKGKMLALTFLGGSLAFLSYLYSSGGLFFPVEIYGRVIYIISLLLYVVSVVLLVLATKPVQWVLPGERAKYKEIQFHSYYEYLVYCKDRYIISIEHNLTQHLKKQKYFAIAVPLLGIGGVVLLIMRSFIV